MSTDQKQDAINQSTIGQSTITPKAPSKVKDIELLKSQLKSYIDTAEDNYTSNYQALWNYCENMYNSVREKAYGVAPWRSNTFIPYPFITVQQEIPAIVDGLIGDGDFFAVVPKPGKEDKQRKAELWQKVIGQAYDEAELFNKAHDCFLWADKTGVGYIKQGWHSETKVRNKYKAKEEIEDGVEVEENIELDTEEEEVQGLLVEVISPHRIGLDPAAENKKELEYLTEYCFVTRGSVEKWKDEVGIVKSEYNAFMKLAEERDFSARFRMYWVYTKKEFYWVICDTDDEEAMFLIRRYANPNEHGNIPMYWMNRFPVPNNIIGKGMIEVIADLCEQANDIENIQTDDIIIRTNMIMAMRAGADIDAASLKIEPGSIVPIENQGDLEVMNLGNTNSTTFNKMEATTSLINMVSGSTAGVTTAKGLSQVNNKTATGASILAYNENLSNNMVVKINRGLWLKPMVKDGAELIEQYADEKYIKGILSEEEYKVWELDDDKFRDTFNIIIKGEVGYVGKQQELERLQIAMQLLGTIPQAAQSLNVELLTKRVLSSLGLPQSLVDFSKTKGQSLNINDYTPEEQQKLEALAKANNMKVEDMLSQIAQGKPMTEFVANAQTNGGNNGL